MPWCILAQHQKAAYQLYMSKQKTSVESHDAEPEGADCGRAHAQAPSAKQGP